MSNPTEVYVWSRENPTTFDVTEVYSSGVEEKNFGGGLVVPVKGVACRIRGGARSFFFYQSCPGLIPLYYVDVGTAIYVSHSHLALRRAVSGFRVKLKDIQLAKEGVAYHFGAKGARRFVVDALTVSQNKLSMPEAGDSLLDLLVGSAEFLRGKKVLTLISAGTDGCLSALALREAGIEQTCLCTGRSEEEFDPKYAAIYAKALSLPYVFLPFPDMEGMATLLREALENIEMTDFSNVLMGVCNTLIANYAVEHGYDYVVNADLADVILGNDMLTYGSFKKQHKEPTSEQWANYRIKKCLHTLPTNLMIFKSTAFAGVTPVQLFANRKVVEFLLSLPLEVTPANGLKPLYYEILDRYIEEGAWKHKRKVGFYTGSGIGQIRLEDELLSDANIRKVYSEIVGGVE